MTLDGALEDALSALDAAQRALVRFSQAVVKAENSSELFYHVYDYQQAHDELSFVGGEAVEVRQGVKRLVSLLATAVDTIDGSWSEDEIFDEDE